MLIQGLLLFAYLSPCMSIRCLECAGMPEPDDCDTVTQCVDGEECFVDEVVTEGGLLKYNLGCRSIQRCSATKRSLPEKKILQQRHDHHSKRDNIQLCQDCCNSTEFCNNQGCGNAVPPMENRGPFCFDCDYQGTENGCRRITECEPHQQCFGVIRATIADAIAMQNLSIVGKREMHLRHPACCNTDFCNDHRKLPNISTGGQTINIDGGWSDWNAWGDCSKTCGLNATQLRRRSCDNPIPAGNGFACHGSGSDTRNCSLGACPVDGQWADWGQWTACTQTCGTGMTRGRSRECTNPAPLNGGNNCVGSPSEAVFCPDVPCPVDGGWTKWGAWTACSQSCGTGSTRQRSRSCANPQPLYGGATCAGSRVETENCTVACPVDGQWSDWGQWSPCPTTCGTDAHYMNRHRQCNNPAPSYGGANCSGSDVETQKCPSNPCLVPVDGGFSDWAAWSSCTETCGTGGWHVRNRLCDNPPPQNNGTDCQGSFTDVKPCDLQNPCDVDGQWSDWTKWSTCTRSCGLTGEKIRTRSCNSPEPRNHGLPCQGLNIDMAPCNRTACPVIVVDGHWSDWSIWSTCPVTCGAVTEKQHRHRKCNNPAPANGGANCTGVYHDNRVCPYVDCPAMAVAVDGQWSDWTHWSVCPVTCDAVFEKQHRHRQCDNPAPANGGANCTGHQHMNRLCPTAACQVVGNWAEWSQWSNCTSACGPAIRLRSRPCDLGNCTGSGTDSEPCIQQPAC